jgi:hypothetical protein
MIAPVSWKSVTRRARRIHGFSRRGFFVPKARCLAPACSGATLLSLAAAFFRALGKKVRGAR